MNRIMRTKISILVCTLLLAVRPDGRTADADKDHASHLSYTAGDTYRVEITIDVISPMQSPRTVSWHIGFELMLKKDPDGNALLAKTKGVKVNAGAAAEGQGKSAEAERFAAYWKGLELRLPLAKGGRLDMEAADEGGGDEYRRALAACLRPLLPPKTTKPGETWSLPAAAGRGEATSKGPDSGLSTGVRPSYGRYEGRVPLEDLDLDTTSPESAVSNVIYCAANTADCSVQVTYWRPEQERLVHTSLYRVTQAQTADQWIRTLKRYSVSLKQ